MKPFKRLISILLCCAMLLTVLPTAALAEEPGIADEPAGDPAVPGQKGACQGAWFEGHFYHEKV